MKEIIKVLLKKIPKSSTTFLKFPGMTTHDEVITAGWFQWFEVANLFLVSMHPVGHHYTN